MFGILADVPECAVAAWLLSGIPTEADYTAAGMDALLQRARAAMHDAQHAEVTAEYQRAGGIWDTSQVTTMHEVHDAALQAKEPRNKAEIEQAVSSMPWLADSVCFELTSAL